MCSCVFNVGYTSVVKMATDTELTAISGDEEELEEGEIDSSDGEEDKEQPEGSDKPPEAVNNTPEPNEQRDTRKRELSPAQNEISPSSRNEKVCCVSAPPYTQHDRHTYAQIRTNIVQ